jgi:glycine oxidase
MSGQPDVLIIGGGVIGLTTAYFLARDGVRVRVVDKSDLGQEASWAGAGILPPGVPSRARNPYDLLLARGSADFPALSAELRDRSGIDNGYVRCGGLEFVEAGEESTVNEWRAEGITFEILPEHELHLLEPALVLGLGTAYHLPDMAQVRNPRHIKALLAGCASLGVQLEANRPVHGFERRGERIIAARTVEGTIHAGQFLVTAGAWTDSLLQEVGWRPGIRPMRGQIALLNVERRLFRHVLLEGARYLVPRDDGRVLVGSTTEDVGFDKRTTAAAIADLLDLAGTLVPALAEAHLERCWAGLRPGSPDGLPYLGLVPGCSNLFVAAGHFRAGIQLSPSTGLAIAELLQGRTPSVPLESFRHDR